MLFQSINPATEEVLGSFPEPTGAEIETAVASAKVAHETWRTADASTRAKTLHAVAEAIDKKVDAFAMLAALEMGKPLTQGRAEVQKCAFLARRLGDTAEALLADEHRPVAGLDARVTYASLGPIFSITPWNFPFWQVARAAFPALAVGNVVINKPAPNVIGCAQALAELVNEAAQSIGAPPHLLQSLALSNPSSAQLIADARIAGVALTGSERAGAQVAALAGQHLKKVVLELGGSDPFIVLADADVKAAAEAAALSRFVNAGQVCIAAKRFLVEASVRTDFEDALVAHVDALTLGDPVNESTTLGPMARGDLRDELDAQAEASIAAGARVVRRGGPLDGPGYHYAPTLITDPDMNSAAMRAETFGPLAALVSIDGLDTAARLANDTPYGLSASIWSRDIERAQALATRIDAGGVFINSPTASHPDLPFGGVKRSGFGRELGVEGLREFANIKTIVVAV